MKEKLTQPTGERGGNKQLFNVLIPSTSQTDHHKLEISLLPDENRFTNSSLAESYKFVVNAAILLVHCCCARLQTQLLKHFQ